MPNTQSISVAVGLTWRPRGGYLPQSPRSEQKAALERIVAHCHRMHSELGRVNLDAFKIEIPVSESETVPAAILPSTIDDAIQVELDRRSLSPDGYKDLYESLGGLQGNLNRLFPKPADVPVGATSAVEYAIERFQDMAADSGEDRWYQQHPDGTISCHGLRALLINGLDADLIVEGFEQAIPLMVGFAFSVR